MHKTGYITQHLWSTLYRHRYMVLIASFCAILPHYICSYLSSPLLIFGLSEISDAALCLIWFHYITNKNISLGRLLAAMCFLFILNIPSIIDDIYILSPVLSALWDIFWAIAIIRFYILAFSIVEGRSIRDSYRQTKGMIKQLTMVLLRSSPLLILLAVGTYSLFYYAHILTVTSPSIWTFIAPSSSTPALATWLALWGGECTNIVIFTLLTLIYMKTPLSKGPLH